MYLDTKSVATRYVDGNYIAQEVTEGSGGGIFSPSMATNVLYCPIMSSMVPLRIGRAPRAFSSYKDKLSVSPLPLYNLLVGGYLKPFWGKYSCHVSNSIWAIARL